MNEERNYRYNDIKERYGRMNAFYIVAAAGIWIMYILYLVFKLGAGSIALPTAYGNLAFIVVFFVSGCIVYIRNRKSFILKQIIAIQVGIEFLLLGMQTDAEFLYFTMLLILALQIPYYADKVYRRFCIGYGILFSVVVVIRGIKADAANDVDGMCRVLCVYLMLFMLYKTGIIAKIFSDHALGTAAEQGRRQKAMLEDILDTGSTVREESAKSGRLVDELVDVTKSVAESMKEITAAMNMTAENIEEQNNMTQNIQEAIEETEERSKEIVEIATDSNQSIQENRQVMEELKEQSEQIASTNQKVTEAMAKLQDKTMEVENIAGMILNISSQTNLLALNASIESARAGEAGRGFAVVADEIKQLSTTTGNEIEKVNTLVGKVTESVKKLSGESNRIVAFLDEIVLKDYDKLEILADNYREDADYYVEVSNVLGTHIENLNISVDGINRIIDTIDASQKELDEAVQSVNENLQKITNASESVSEETKDVMKSVASLQGTVEQFHL